MSNSLCAKSKIGPGDRRSELEPNCTDLISDFGHLSTKVEQLIDLRGCLRY